jgi:Putative porin
MEKSRLFRSFFVAAVAFALAFAQPVLASEEALLDLLVKKKLITPQDAAAVRAELKTEKKASSGSGAAGISSTATAEIPVTKTSAEKWKLSTPITELELYGDVRMRYEIRNGENATDDAIQRNRERYRIRLGLHGTLTDDWFFGVRLETSQSPRSTNVTFGDDTSTSSPAGGGPFAKGSDGINVGQAFLGYKGIPDLTLTAGKMQNPLIYTLMTWDADINPEGLAEQWKHTFTIDLGGGEAEEPRSYTKDGTALPSVKAKASGSKLKIDLFANFAQFVYDDTNPENPLGPSPNKIPNTDSFMMAWQVGARFTFPNSLYAQVAPTLYNYTGNGDTFNTFFQGGDPTLSNSASTGQNQTGINSLLVFDLPVEVGWKLGELPMRLFADFAVNLQADDRAAAAGHPGKGDQRYAYQIGGAVGQLKKKGDWQLTVFWQRQDQYSLDPNLVDTEFWDSKLNLQGVGATFAYMLSDAVWVNFLYGYAETADDSLGTGGGGDIAINPLKNFQIFQADLNLKF